MPGYSVRETSRSLSGTLSCRVSIIWEIAGIFPWIPPKRSGPSLIFHRMCGFHFPPITSIAASIEPMNFLILGYTAHPGVNPITVLSSSRAFRERMRCSEKGLNHARSTMREGDEGRRMDGRSGDGSERGVTPTIRSRGRAAYLDRSG